MDTRPRVELPSIGIVIASKDRPRDIAVVLQSVTRQTFALTQIVVVDQSTIPYDLAAFPGVTHVHDPTIGGAASARNRGNERIEAEVTLFLDDDVELEPDSCNALAEAFRDNPDAIAIQCRDRLAHDDGRLTRVLERIFERGFFATNSRRCGDDWETTALEGYALGIRANALGSERFDEFLEGYSLGEDWELSKRLARYGRLLVVASARVAHHRSPKNRLSSQEIHRKRWVNYDYFYRKWRVNERLSGRIAHAWWTVGETYKWLRSGMGFPCFPPTPRTSSRYCDGYVSGPLASPSSASAE